MSEEQVNQENCVQFPEERNLVFCSWNECGNGHRWPLVAITAKCDGCGTPVLVTKMDNCPACNEPSKTSGIRVDHVHMVKGQPIPVVRFCQGQPSPAEVVEMRMHREHWKQMQEAPEGQTPLSVKTGEQE